MNLEAKIINFILKAVGAKRIAKRLLLNPKRSKSFKFPNRLKRKFDTNQFVINGHNTVTISPGGDNKSNHIIFLHGGAYTIGPYNAHWWVIEQLAIKSGFTVSLINYPKAPEYSWRESHEMIFSTYSRLNEMCPDDRFFFVGDSAGGGLSLNLARKVRDHAKLKMPEKIVLLSPWVDISMRNPEINDLVDKDFLLDPATLLTSAKLYANELDLQDPLVSPLYGSMENLNSIAVYVGTHEIFLPDCRRFKEKVEATNTALHYSEYEGMQHDWVVFQSPGSRRLINEIIQYLTNEGAL